MIGMESSRDVEFVFEPQVEGGYHAYAPELLGLHTEGDSLEEATANAEEALALYVEGLREEGGSLQTGIVRRLNPRKEGFVQMPTMRSVPGSMVRSTSAASKVALPA